MKLFWIYIKLLLALIIYILIVSVAQAHDEDGRWFCDSQASIIQGQTITVCGVALGSSEAEARRLALSNAMTEFHALHPVKGKYSVYPGRTDCNQEKGHFRCVRLVKLIRR